jgi:prephenate dehydrogenase
MPAATDPPFQTIAVVGLGLIGGSIALGVRDRWPSIRVTGVDSSAILAHALGGGAIDRAVESIADLPPTDLVILAAPVQQNISLLRQLESAAAAPAVIVTDVGGTKRAIVEAGRSLSSRIHFVGGHPLGGGERGGFAFARPDLFAGRPWILTPDGESASPAVDLLSRLAAGLGARPMTLDAAEHDRLMAFVSHLPQLAASTLMATVGGTVGAEGLRMAGRGLLDTTRLASSPADLWRDVCATNADGIAEALDRLIAALGSLRADLQRGEAIDTIFGEAAHWRAELTKSVE